MPYHHGKKTESLSRMVRKGTVEILKTASAKMGMTDAALLNNIFLQLEKMDADQLKDFITGGRREEKTRSAAG